MMLQLLHKLVLVSLRIHFDATLWYDMECIAYAAVIGVCVWHIEATANDDLQRKQISHDGGLLFTVAPCRAIAISVAQC